MKGLFEQPIWIRGFRPFFILGALHSVAVLILWGGFYAGHLRPPTFLYDPVLWHAHEMIYGFTMAIVAGFLLTAVANWTRGAPVRNGHLACLCLLWILGRLAMSVDMGLPPWLLYGAELIFIPALMVSLALPLFKSRNIRNFVFLGLLGGLLGCDVWFLATSSKAPLYFSLMMILIMVSLIGGRVIPAFTVAGARRQGIALYQRNQPLLDRLALLSLLAVTVCLILYQGTITLTVCAGVAAVIHALRMGRYHVLQSFIDPMLWILHLGYSWLVLGLGLLALTGFTNISLTMIVHTLTIGCIGSMCLGMMCRVSLGHTGRDMIASPMTVVTFFLMQGAVLLRVIGPILFPEYITEWIVSSAVAWTICFMIYLWVYGPMLLTKSPDEPEDVLRVRVGNKKF